jgi:predicted enzyme related to lactoylglutathione lyase
MKISEYPAGVPCWVDLTAPDVTAAAAFYGELLGWEPRSRPDADGYVIFHRDGHPVAGVGPCAPGEPPAWNWYAATTDIEESARRAVEAGGRVLAGPMDVLDEGRAAAFADDAGVSFGAWQPWSFPGATLVNEVGGWCWSELTTRHPDQAAAYFARALDWTTEPIGTDEQPYLAFKLGDRVVAGMMPMVGERWPAEMPDHWVHYFAVDDCDATCAELTRLGGAVAVPATDSPEGRFAIASDPAGALFAVIALPEG